MKILVVDDNNFSAEMLKTFIEEYGADYVRATGGREAMDIFAESEINEFDLIFMDIVMAYGNGDQITEEIRKMDRTDSKTVKIFAATTRTNSFDEEFFDGVINKPFQKKEIYEILDSLK